MDISWYIIYPINLHDIGDNNHQWEKLRILHILPLRQLHRAGEAMGRGVRHAYGGLGTSVGQLGETMGKPWKIEKTIGKLENGDLVKMLI